MDNFIRVYQNAFSDEVCDRLISKFESTELEERERHEWERCISLKSILEGLWLETRTRRTCKYIFITH